MGFRFRPGRIVRFLKGDFGKPLIKLKSFVVQIVDLVTKAIIPRRCASCGAILVLEGLALPLCPECSKAVFPLEATFDVSSQLARPSACGAKPAMNVTSVFAYQGLIPALILKLKYGRAFWLAKDMGRLMAVVSAKYGPFDFIVAVPASPGRQLKRGYNQAFLLAKEISLVLHTSILPRAIYHKKTNKSQRDLSLAERWERASVSFFKGQPFPKGAKILLVDDVVTSGATLTVCADILFECGASSVTAVTIASALTS